MSTRKAEEGEVMAYFDLSMYDEPEAIAKARAEGFEAGWRAGVEEALKMIEVALNTNQEHYPSDAIIYARQQVEALAERGPKELEK